MSAASAQLEVGCEATARRGFASLGASRSSAFDGTRRAGRHEGQGRRPCTFWRVSQRASYRRPVEFKDEIETWLWNSRDSLIADLGFDTAWWPNALTKAAPGAAATAWALSFFLEAAKARCFGKDLHLHTHGKAGSQVETIIKSRWVGAGRQHSPKEVLVDASVHNWDAASPIQLTGESEVRPTWDTGDSLEGRDDYSWDFYKLLVVPSATRLFFARLSGRGKGTNGIAAGTRIQELLTSLQGIVDLYGPAMMRPGDELGGAIVPFSAKLARTETVVFWLERGRLRHEKATKLAVKEAILEAMAGEDDAALDADPLQNDDDE